MEEASSLASSLFAVLYPGEAYVESSESSRERLASRLAQIAESISPQHSNKKSRRDVPQTRRGGGRASEDRGPDFAACPYAYVALRIAYFGWRYYGFARLKDIEETVEGHFFNALRRGRLIPPEADPLELDYSRCGRTDKGVSASGQVVALKLRSVPEGRPPLDYVTIINRNLPEDIRVLGCSPVSESFHARFDAGGRHYKYFFVQDGSYDLVAMNRAAAAFVGEHNFKNFCKTDDSVNTYVRRIDRCYIEPCATTYGAAGDGIGPMCVFNVQGSAFLWHQVRCMMSVLQSVGKGALPVSSVEKYLDLDRQTSRPQYTMAREEPLLLFRCAFDGNLEPEDFSIAPSARTKVVAHLTTMARDLRIKHQLVMEVLEGIR